MFCRSFVQVRLHLSSLPSPSTFQRTVDRLYVDRTFGGQDWFGLRQQVLKVTIDVDRPLNLRKEFRFLTKRHARSSLVCMYVRAVGSRRHQPSIPRPSRAADHNVYLHFIHMSLFSILGSCVLVLSLSTLPPRTLLKA